jgi:dihydrofolate reductase
MRKIVAGLFVSLDGVVESPDKWMGPYDGEEVDQAIESSMAAADIMLLGRHTYQEFAGYWADKPSDVRFADYLNTTPKLVVSTNLNKVEWQNSTLISTDVAEEIAKLKQQAGKNIYMSGSATLVGWLLRQGLLDELELFVFPVLVGHGKRLFEGDPVALKLAESKVFRDGVLHLTYQVAGT